VANRFANNSYVVGFDPINEPFPADIGKDTSLMEAGVFDSKLLAPLYEKVHEKYIAANPQSINYFETGQYPDAYLGVVNPAGFDVPPGGEINSANHVLNDHSYCCQLGDGICDSGEPDTTRADDCQKWHELRIKTRAEDAKRL
jgi:hypothetical protein